MTDFFLYTKNGVMVDSSEPFVVVKSGTRTVTLLGSVEFIADYNALTLSRPRESDVATILQGFCQSTNPVKDVHLLTDLVGPFILVVQDLSTIRYVYKSDDIDVPTYFASASGGLVIHTSWLKALECVDRLEVSQRDVARFLIYKSCEYPRTFFKNITRLKPYSLYELSGDDLSLLAHSYPGFHTLDPLKPPRYTIDDYVRVLTCYKDHFSSFSLAYSGGVDSNILANAYEGKVLQFLTLRYEEPYISPIRLREAKSSREMARKHGANCTEVAVDLEDARKLDPYFRHYAKANPFSSYPAVHFYALAEQALAPVILHGQNADNVWDWGFHQIYFSKGKPHSTSSEYILSRIAIDVAILRDRSASVKTKVRRIATRYVTRLAMIRSFKRIWLRRLIELARPLGPEYDRLTGFPYKMFTLQRYINYCTTGESLSWVSSADYYSRRSVAPYVSPLALHVNSHIPRNSFFDIKRPFRRYTSEFDPSVMKMDEAAHVSSQSLDQSPVFDHASAIGQDLLGPELSALVDGSTNRIARHHVYCVLEQVSRSARSQKASVSRSGVQSRDYGDSDCLKA